MMDLINKIKGWFIMTERNLFVICATLVMITAISSIAYYNLQKDRLMSANIENGIVKGVDPVAIKCAYDSNGTMCVLYAATKHTDSPVSSKK
jgi:hypothetical protein